MSGRCVLAGALATVIGWSVVAAARGTEEESPVASRAAELERIRDEIARLTARLVAVRQETSGLEQDLERLSLERALQERRVAESIAGHQLASERVQASRAELERLESALAREREALSRRLTGLYRLGRHGSLRLLLASEYASEVLPAVRWARYLSRREASTVERFTTLRARASVEREELERAERRAAAWAGEQEARRAELARLELAWSRRLESRRLEGEELTHRALSLAESARKLANFVATLSGSAGLEPAGIPMEQFRGLLEWPARGKLRVSYGIRIDRRYGTRVRHDGVELATEPGVPVEAIYGGRVAFAAPFEGYGNTAILMHPGKIVSLYARLRQLEVQRGDVVSLRSRLGTAGESLYFEIRIEQRPTDPQLWMREKLP